MKRLVYVVLLILSFSLMIVSCSKSTTEPVNSQQDISNVENEAANFGGEVNQILETEGGKALLSFLSTKSNLKSNSIITHLGKSFLNLDKTGLLKKLLSSSTDLRSDLDWKESWGTYIWNADSSKWNTNLDSTLGKVVWQFPKNSNSTENNAKLEWTKYTTTINDTPSSLHFDLYINQDVKEWNEVAYIDYSAEFDANETPTSISFTLSVTPYSLNFNFSQTNTKVSADFEVVKADNSTPIFSFGAYADFSDVANIENTLTKLGAHFQYNKMKLDISFDFEKFNSVQNPTIDDFNEALSGGFYYNNIKVGTITVIFNEETQETTILVVFNDGTNVKLEDLLEKFFNAVTYDLKSFFENIS